MLKTLDLLWFCASCQACGNADAGVIRLILNACKTRADFGAVDSLSSIGETRPTEVQHEIPDSNSESSSGRKFPEVASLREGSNGGAAKTPSADTKGLTLAAATSEGDVVSDKVCGRCRLPLGEI